jgi:hypothetical protein
VRGKLQHLVTARRAIAVEHGWHGLGARRAEHLDGALFPARVSEHGVDLGGQLVRQPVRLGGITRVAVADDEALAGFVDEDGGDRRMRAGEAAHVGAVHIFLVQLVQDLHARHVVTEAARQDGVAAEPRHRDGRVGSNAA